MIVEREDDGSETTREFTCTRYQDKGLGAEIDGKFMSIPELVGRFRGGDWEVKRERQGPIRDLNVPLNR